MIKSDKKDDNKLIIRLILVYIFVVQMIIILGFACEMHDLKGESETSKVYHLREEIKTLKSHESIRLSIRKVTSDAYIRTIKNLKAKVKVKEKLANFELSEEEKSLLSPILNDEEKELFNISKIDTSKLDYLTIGSTTDDILRILGPQKKYPPEWGDRWYGGYDFQNFNLGISGIHLKNGKIDKWENRGKNRYVRPPMTLADEERYIKKEAKTRGY